MCSDRAAAASGTPQASPGYPWAPLKRIADRMCQLTSAPCFLPAELDSRLRLIFRQTLVPMSGPAQWRWRSPTPALLMAAALALLACSAVADAASAVPDDLQLSAKPLTANIKRSTTTWRCGKNELCKDAKACCRKTASSPANNWTVSPAGPCCRCSCVLL